MKKSLLLSLACCILLQAEAPLKSDPLSALSLEDLMNIQVTSTSRREESQQLAPGVITVVTSQEIHQFGARHLRDVIDRLVGTQVLGSHLYGYSKTSVRGMNSAPTEGSVLLLLNGRPIRDATDGGTNQDIYLGFPLETIDHIEVVRGPGSVIYGTNAMAGVINIITRDGRKSINETRVDVGAGSFNRQQLQLSTLVGGADYSLNIGLNAIRSKGDSVGGITDQDLNAGTYETGEHSDNLLINGNYHNFTFNSLVTNDTYDSGSSAFQLPSQPTKKTRRFLDVGYLYDIANGWDASINYTLNQGTFDWRVNKTVGKNYYTDRSEMVEAIIRGNITNNLNVLFGANHVMNATSFDLFMSPTQRSNVSAYTQIDYMLSTKQKLIAGLQWNKHEYGNSDVSPRAGFIYGFGDNWWLKLLYSEAYRSASLIETNINAPQLKGNPNLLPEKVATYDAQLIYQTPNHYLALSLYDSMLNNPVARSADIPPSHINEGSIHFQGIELESRTKVDDGINLIGNFSYQVNKTNNGVKDSTFSPNIMAKLGVNYERIHGINIGVFNSYIGTSTDLNITNGAPAINPKAAAYNLLTANISIDPGKVWGTGKPDHSLIALYLDNILNEKVFMPDLQYANRNNTVPGHWGRSANLTYTYKF